MREPRDSPHVLVVGAGIVGASIAWHLARAGARVTVVEAGDGGGVATPRSFAWINASWGNPEPYFRLRIRAMAEWRRLAAELPEMPLRWCGGLCWDLPPGQLEAYAREHGGWGYGIRRVDRSEAGRLEPNLVEPPAFALHVAEEGAVEPHEAARVLLAAAERRGATVVSSTAATSLFVTAGRVLAIETGAGRLAADEIVLAAGAETAALARTAGVRLPLTAPSGLLVHSRPHAPLLNGLVLAPELHMRQTAAGRIVVGADFGGTDPGVDPHGTARALFEQARAMLRGADSLAPELHAVGERPTPADGFPVIGRPAGLAGLTIAVMHSGITLAAAVGLFVADEILADRRDPLLAPYGPMRFSSGGLRP
jgi:glycine/D-amino acid oxidase-like deaminating enzyme